MKNRVAISLCLVFFTTSLYSQLTQNNYIPLKCAGETPSTFLETAEEKYKKEQEQFLQKKIKELKRTKMSFTNQAVIC